MPPTRRDPVSEPPRPDQDPSVKVNVISCITGETYESTHEEVETVLEEVKEAEDEHVREIHSHILDRYRLPKAIRGEDPQDAPTPAEQHAAEVRAKVREQVREVSKRARRA